MKVKTKVKAGYCNHECKGACRENFIRCGTKPNCPDRYQRCIHRCGCS